MHLQAVQRGEAGEARVRELPRLVQLQARQAAQRRQVRHAPVAEPPTTGAHAEVSTAASREGSRLSRSSSRAEAQPKLR